MENNSERILSELPEVSLYEQIKDRIEITETGSSKSEDRNRVAGTYMPRYLLDYVIMTCDISYYKLIHELMDSIDAVAQERQVKFVEELQSNISEQNRKLERKRAKITRLDQLCNELRESNTNLANQMTEVREQNNQLLEDNRHTHAELAHANQQLTTLQTDINDMQGNLQQVVNNINETREYISQNFNERNLTLGHVQERLVLFQINELTESTLLHNGNQIYDIFAGNPKHMRSAMSKRDCPPTQHEYDHPVGSINTSDGKDLLNYVRNNMNQELGYITSDSKLVTAHINEVIRYIQACVGIVAEVHKTVVVDSLANSSQNLLQIMTQRFNRIEQVHQEQINQVIRAQEQQQEQINQIMTAVQTIRDLLTQKRPNAVSVYSNGRYRELITQADGTIVYVPRARSSEIELTEEDIRNLKFKDANGRFVNYRE